MTPPDEFLPDASDWRKKIAEVEVAKASEEAAKNSAISAEKKSWAGRNDDDPAADEIR